MQRLTLARTKRNAARGAAAALLTLLATGAGQAAPTSIADMPLITSNEFHAKPNLMFVLDNSGSMANDYMPDDMKDDEAYGFKSAQCNGVAYDPDTNVSYAAPVKDDGTSMTSATYTSAWTDGYTKTGGDNLSAVTSTDSFTTSTSVSIASSGNATFTFTTPGYSSSAFKKDDVITLKLSNSDSNYMTAKVTDWTAGSTNVLKVSVTGKKGSGSGKDWSVPRTGSYYYVYTGSQKRMSWTYSPGLVSNTFANECRSDVGDTPGSTVFTKVYVAAAEQQRYANWYSFYRTRRLLMRTAVGQALKALNDEYRVGFSTISYTGVSSSNDGFQDVGDFTGAQRTSLYTKLYAATGNSNTPLRGALSKIGRYYANRIANQTDPVQYACQRNYTLLTTDGYWNIGSESNSYGPKDLSGSNVGNRDAVEERPMQDGSVGSLLYTRTTDRVGIKNGNGCSGGQYRVATTTQTSTNLTTWTPTATGPSSSNGTCRAADYIVANGGKAVDASGIPAGVSSPATSSTVFTNGSSNSLADVAAYYYNTDLRNKADWNNCTSTAAGTNQDVCSDVVEASGRDTARHQHMTTYTVGLGVSGTLAYDKDYLTQASGDYVDLQKAPGVSGKKDWPVPTESDSGGDARQIDDLWHAAVNGRGQYYSALNATQLAEAIKGVTDAIGEKFGSAAAATTSTLELVSGDDNQVYRASYTTGTWVGDLEAFTLDGDTGEIGKTNVWSVQKKLTESTVYSDRKIYYLKPGAALLRAFTYANLNADNLGSKFINLCSTPSKASQCAGLSDTEKTAANDGTRLVNFLRGDRTFEKANQALSTTKPLYRTRAGVLGDIVNGAPKFVGKPSFGYSDAGYTDFVQAQKARPPMLYVAANDGMLHAISASTTTDGDGGKELWAYVPTAAMTEMYRLADTSYRSGHRYFVDAPPVVGDIYVDGAWKTILVGGLGKGGRSYYALDITDPEDPKALWEFSDDNLGLTFGNPVITKRADGTWVVIFSSGYNNVSPGDGVGRLFVVNANTGVRARTDITTGVGSTDTPSGLDKINGWIDLETDNTTKRVYAGDLQGNLWRFDIDGLIEPKNRALQLASFVKDAKPQPITTRPRLAEANKQTVVIVGTGQYLDTGDITDVSTQTIYTIKDALGSTGIGDARTNDTLVQQALSVNEDDADTKDTDESKTASITKLPINWVTNNGWWVDLPHRGERVATDIAMQSGVLAIATAIPRGDACESGGGSWNYFLGVSTGSSLENPAGAEVASNSLVVGQSFVRMADGTLRLLRQLSDGTTKIVNTPAGSSSNLVPQRTSWRELTD